MAALGDFGGFNEVIFMVFGFFMHRYSRVMYEAHKSAEFAPYKDQFNLEQAMDLKKIGS